MGAGRPRTAIGEMGKISKPKLLSNGTYQVTAAVRLSAGEKRISSSGMSARSAVAALHAKRDRVLDAAEPGVDNDPLFSTLGAQWLILKKRRLAVQSAQRYEATLTGSIGRAIGTLSISELTNPMLRRLIRRIEDDGHSSEARTARVVLRGVLAHGAEMGVCKPELFNFDGLQLPVSKKEAIALSPDDAQEIRRLIQVGRDAVRPGPRSTKAHDDLIDFVDLALATSLRISEVLALTDSTVNLTDPDSPMVYVEQKIEYVRGAGYRLGVLKTIATRRGMLVPNFASDIIRRRSDDLGRDGLLFHTAEGRPLSQNNIRRTLRNCLAGSDLAWVGPHDFRKTLISVVDEALGSHVAAAIAGHGNENLIKNHTYAERRVITPDVRELSNRFAPAHL